MVFFQVQVSFLCLIAGFNSVVVAYLIIYRLVHAFRRPLTAARIDDEYVHLRNVHLDYMARLPEWPGN